MSKRVLAPISDAELERRWLAVRKEMADRRIDALVMRATTMAPRVRQMVHDLPAVNGYRAGDLSAATEDVSKWDPTAPAALHGKSSAPRVARHSLRLYLRLPQRTYQDEIVRTVETAGLSTIGWIGAGGIPPSSIAHMSRRYLAPQS